MGLELVVRSVNDGNTNDVVKDDDSLDSSADKAGRYLPLGSRRTGLASVADAKLHHEAEQDAQHEVHR